MKKKIIGIFVMMLLIATVFSVIGETEKKIHADALEKSIVENNSNPLNYGLLLDQKQDKTDGYGLSVYDDGPYSLYAQEFVPSMSSLGEIRLKMFPINDPEPYYFELSIRDELDGEDIAMSSTIAYYGWVKFPFSNVELTPGETYSMVIRALGGNDRSYYCWHMYFGSIDVYPFGQAWDNSARGEWTVTYIRGNEFLDFCFKTYCWNNPPEIPNINGPTSGEPEVDYEYMFSAIEVDDEDITQYEIDWGDDSDSYIIGPFSSGETVIKHHNWTEEGNYTIKARAFDIHGESGNWGTLEVSMPKSKAINTPFLRFLENHPHLFPLLRQLIGWT